MDRHLEEAEFTVFDTETTGLDPFSGDRIVEIAGVRVKGDKRLAVFQTLVNPRRPVCEAAFQVNRITQEMLREAPGAESAIPEFLKFAQGSCLCSYNAGFDLKFLDNELKLIGGCARNGGMSVDILKMARRLVPGLERYALWFVAGHFGIRGEQKHRAFSDVELALDVFRRLKELFYLKGLHDLKSFLHLFSIDAGLLEDLNNQKIAQIQKAITLGVRIKMRYLTASSASISEREVIPKKIKQENKSQYMVAFCFLRNGERTFRIDGILHMEIV